MSLPKLQTAVVQSPALPASSPADESLPLAVSDSVPIPVLPSSHHVLVRVLAVALNPTDFKMVTYFPRPFHGDTPALPIGCDFCGVVEDGSESALRSFPVGTRVCGGLFPYGHADKGSNAVSGAFAQWVAADANQLLRVPDGWDDLQGAAVGGICWGTCVLALFEDPEALALPGRPSKPEEKGRPVVVYGGATATGTMACQLLKLSGHYPIAVCSASSTPLVRSYGAIGTAAYTSPTCAESVRALSPDGVAIRHALDCITSPESVATCFAAIGRAGGRYACLEALNDEWRTRKAIRTKEVMGFEGFGLRVTLGQDKGTTYSREANPELYARGNQWAGEMQAALDGGKIKAHPVREVHGRWEGIIEGLGMLRRGEVRGQKLVVRVGDA